MNTNKDLDKIISKLGLSKEDYLFLTIKTVYLYEMKSGDKNVEYREPGDFILSRLYKNYTKNVQASLKNCHIFSSRQVIILTVGGCW